MRFALEIILDTKFKLARVDSLCQRKRQKKRKIKGERRMRERSEKKIAIP